MIGIWNLVLGLSSAARVVAEAALELGIWRLKICLGFGARHSEPVRQAGLGFGISSAARGIWGFDPALITEPTL